MQPPAMPQFAAAPVQHTPLPQPNPMVHSGENLQRQYPRNQTPPGDSNPIAQQSYPAMPMHMQGSSPHHNPYVSQGQPQYPVVQHAQTAVVGKKSSKWIWYVVALLVLGASAGALLAMIL
jgi:hypothetical protein